MDVVMEMVSAGEFQRNFGHYQDRALIEPVMVTSNGRERLVVLAAEEFKRLMRRDRQVMGLEDFKEADLAALRKVQPSAASAFDHEVTD
jgi:prevent-host-death family protein